MCLEAHRWAGGAEGVGEYVETGGYRSSLGVEVGRARGEGGYVDFGAFWTDRTGRVS